MSISKFQNVMKGGCGQIVMVGMAVVFIGGLAYQGCGSGFGGGPKVTASGDVEVAQVSGVPISAKAIDAAVATQMQQFGGMTESIPPSFEILLMGQALNQAIEKANSAGLAKQNNIDVSDAAIKSFIEAEIAKLPTMARDQLTQAGQIKPGATDAELDAVVKKQTGKTMAELIKSQREEVLKALDDPEKGPTMRTQITQLLVVDSYKKRAKVSDDDVRKSFDVTEIKRIVVPFQGATPGGISPTTGATLNEAAAKTKADKALTEVRAGKSFEDAMTAYSTEPPTTPGKKVSDNVLPLSDETLANNPQYASIRGLKAGEVSGVEKTAEGFVITKVIGKKNDPPKDFAANVAKYREPLAIKAATKAYQDDLKRYGESNAPKFSSDAYSALYAFTKLSAPKPDAEASPGTPPAPPTEAQLREVINMAKGVGKNEPDYRIAALVRRAAFDKLYEQAKDKTPLTDERIETLQFSLDAKDDFDGRIELVDAFLGQRKYKEAADQLAAAARANTTYDPQGQTRFGTVASKLVALKKDGQLSADAEKQVLGEQDRWRDEKKNADAAQADAAQQAAKDAAAKAAAERAAKAKPKVEDVPPRR